MRIEVEYEKPGDRLSPAEAEIAAALVHGLPLCEIGRGRRTSQRTLANQMASIYRKLRVSSRTELAHTLSGRIVSGSGALEPVWDFRARLVRELEGDRRRRFELQLFPTPLLAASQARMVHALARGVSMKAISIDLGCSSSTVCTALQRAMAALGVRDRFQLLRLFAPVARSIAEMDEVRSHLGS
jgi:DNA-binding NarL/FixJ family response regulator